VKFWMWNQICSCYFVD